MKGHVHAEINHLISFEIVPRFTWYKIIMLDSFSKPWIDYRHLDYAVLTIMIFCLIKNCILYTVLVVVWHGIQRGEGIYSIWEKDSQIVYLLH
jgi:hypothetical protein